MRALPSAFTAQRSKGVCRLVFFVLLVVATTNAGCRRRDEPRKKESTNIKSAVATASPLPPLASPERTWTLAVRDQRNAELLIPVGITTARPLVAVLLPPALPTREHCEALGEMIRERAFVLCLSGRMEQSIDGAGEFEASELKLAINIVKQRFPNYVVAKDWALVGVGEAANAVVGIVRRAPEVFHRVGFLNGGFHRWTSVDATRFAAAGAKGLLVRCTGSVCTEAQRVAATVRVAGIPTRLETDDESAKDAGRAERDRKTDAPLLAWLLDVGVGP